MHGKDPVCTVAYSEATLEAALLCFKYHKESNTTYQERLQLLSYVCSMFMYNTNILVFLYLYTGEVKSYW